MPNFNQTGPNGQGPMTGRKMGRYTNFGNIKNNDSEIYSSNFKTPKTQNGKPRGFCAGWRINCSCRKHQQKFKGGL